ncbi:hypothetical protein [Desulfofustis limnaeus]|uniref:Uncharacterized protein n=1 Tax=Desulfofustis limnaeus TaxID=2740163 RepID=A0ABN6M3C7_9BACT|nr:hypothetical protein [Desulfofustis limnaeus]BDD86098.1 hypothetical protein DPPLL_04630 [Desulfofustis limnaeus]
MSMQELVRFTVPAEELTLALAVIERFSRDRLANGVLRHYYTFLPEGREEMATDVRLVARQAQLALVALATTQHRYLYLCSAGEVVLLGDFDRGIDDEEVLASFGWGSDAEFRSRFPSFADLEELADDGPGNDAGPASCVACGVAPGELHVFGCPVELCPWCEGQLSRCNCRFDQLDTDQIDSDEQLDRFADVLAEKGRVPFSVDQNPAYPSAGTDEPPAASDADGRPEGDSQD